MKSIIKSLSRSEQRVYLIFELDDKTIDRIEKIFQSINSKFQLSYYKKLSGSNLNEFWEKNDVEFSFSLTKRGKLVKLKINASLKFVNKFLKLLDDHAEFAELSPRARIKFDKLKKN